jgi:hypothetical protein
VIEEKLAAFIEIRLQLYHLGFARDLQYALPTPLLVISNLTIEFRYDLQCSSFHSSGTKSQSIQCNSHTTLKVAAKKLEELIQAPPSTWFVVYGGHRAQADRADRADRLSIIVWDSTISVVATASIAHEWR